MNYYDKNGDRVGQGDHRHWHSYPQLGPFTILETRKNVLTDSRVAVVRYDVSEDTSEDTATFQMHYMQNHSLLVPASVVHVDGQEVPDEHPLTFHSFVHTRRADTRKDKSQPLCTWLEAPVGTNVDWYSGDNVNEVTCPSCRKIVGGLG